MKLIKIILSVALLLLSLSANATVTVQQPWTLAAACCGSGTAKTVSLGGGTTPPLNGDIVIALAECRDTASPCTIADTFGDSGSWVNAVSTTFTLDNYTVYIWYKVIVGTATGYTITVTNTGVASGIMVATAEYNSSVGGTWSLDNTSVVANGYGGTLNPGAITTTSADAVLVGYPQSNGTLTSTGTGFAVVQTYTGEASNLIPVVTKIATSIGSYDSTFSVTPNSGYTIAMAAFKLTTSGGSSISTINGLAKASVGTVNGLAIGSVSGVDGLP